MARGTEAKVTMVVDTKRPIKSIADLTKKIQEMRNEIEGTPLGTKRFNELAAAISNASGQMKTLEMSMEGLDPMQKAESFLKLGEGIAGGFAVGQGAMALFGTESEALMEIQTRVQGAIAIAMGVRMMSEAALQVSIAKRVIVEKFATITTGKGRIATLLASAGNWIMTGSTVALTAAKGGATIAAIALRIAMMAIPFMAVIGGVTALVGACISWFSASENNVDSQLRMNAATQESNRVFQSQLDYKNALADAETDEAKRLVELQELMRLENEELSNNNDALKKNEENLKNINDFSKEGQRIVKNNTKVLKNNSDIIQADITYYNDLVRAQEKLLKLQEDTAQAEKDRLKKVEDDRKAAHDRYLKRQEDKKGQEKDLAKLLEEIHLLGMSDDDEREKQKNQYARNEALRGADGIRDKELKRQMILSINDKYDQLELNRLQKIQDEKDKIEQDGIDEQEENKKQANLDLRQSIKDELHNISQIKAGERQAELNDVKAHFDKLLSAEDLTGQERRLLEAEVARQKKEINDTYNEEKRIADKELLDAQIGATLDAMASMLGAIQDNMSAQMSEIDQKAERDLAVEGLTEIQRGKIQKKADNKKKKIDNKRKKIAAGMAIIETYKGATMAFSSLASIPVVGPVLGGIAAGAAVLAGLANVRQIYATDIGGGGGGGGGSAPAPKPQPRQPASTGAFTLGGADPSKKPIKAYVVTDEMSDSQQQLEGIREESTI